MEDIKNNNAIKIRFSCEKEINRWMVIENIREETINIRLKITNGLN